MDRLIPLYSKRGRVARVASGFAPCRGERNLVVISKRWPYRVAVLFSGGETPGMNALLRNVVRLGVNRHGAEVIGVKDGYTGLVQVAQGVHSGYSTVDDIEEELARHRGLAGLHRANQNFVIMDHASVSGLLGRGGIVLGCSRCAEFREVDVRWRAIELLWNLGVTAVIVCGGEGSLAGAARLAGETELRVVGVPATLDNDVPMTEIALGVDTAANTVTTALGRLAGTAVHQRRVMVVEVMGRNSGELARMAALASGVEIVVTPERGPLTMEKIEGIGATGAVAAARPPACERAGSRGCAARSGTGSNGGCKPDNAAGARAERVLLAASALFCRTGGAKLRAGVFAARGPALGRRPDPRRPLCRSGLGHDHDAQ